MLIAMLLDLKNSHTVSVVYPINHTRVDTLLTAWQNNSQMPDGEFSVVLQIDGILVGIRTMGDTIGSVWDSVVFFEKYNCNIGVLACHEDHLLRSGSCLANEWESEEIKKERVSDSSLIDKDMAKTLFDKVINAVNQKIVKNN